MREDIQCVWYLERRSANTANKQVNGSHVRKNCGKKGNWTRECRGGADAGDGGKKKDKGKGSANTSLDGNCRNCGRCCLQAETCWSTSPSKPHQERSHGKAKQGKQVNGLELGMPGVERARHLEVSPAMCFRYTSTFRV